MHPFVQKKKRLQAVAPTVRVKAAFALWSLRKHQDSIQARINWAGETERSEVSWNDGWIDYYIPRIIGCVEENSLQEDEPQNSAQVKQIQVTNVLYKRIRIWNENYHCILFSIAFLNASAEVCNTCRFVLFSNKEPNKNEI